MYSVRLKVNLKTAQGVVIRKGTVFEGALEELPENIQVYVNEKDTRVCEIIHREAPVEVVPQVVPEILPEKPKAVTAKAANAKIKPRTRK